MKSLKDVPDKARNKYPARLLVAITSRTERGLELLKKQGKDKPEFVRRLLDEALNEVLGPDWDKVG